MWPPLAVDGRRSNSLKHQYSGVSWLSWRLWTIVYIFSSFFSRLRKKTLFILKFYHFKYYLLSGQWFTFFQGFSSTTASVNVLLRNVCVLKWSCLLSVFNRAIHLIISSLDCSRLVSNWQTLHHSSNTLPKVCLGCGDSAWSKRKSRLTHPRQSIQCMGK